MDDISKEETGDIIKKTLSKTNENGENVYMNYFLFDLSYEMITQILKDIQTTAQLIKLIVYSQISDIIFIKGNNSYTINARFYFRYKNIIDFYVKVLEFFETDYFTKVVFFIYKTKPKSIEFRVIFLIFNKSENTTEFHIQIILPENHFFSSKIVKIIYNELRFNYTYLIQAIKSNKMNSYILSSSIIKSEYFVLTRIIQNIKLIEYIVKGKIIKVEDNQKDNILIKHKKELINEKENSFIKMKDEFKISLTKINDKNILAKIDSIHFKILLIKIKEDKMIMQVKVLFNNQYLENNNSIFNTITICIRKLTGNSCFMFIKYIWDLSLNNNIINFIKKTIKKCLINIEKLGKTAKNY